MVDHLQTTVCCMCGDVGFADKLFRCSKCRHRFQHSYCSNYYSENAEPIEVCDWCQSEERNNARHGSSSRKYSVGVHHHDNTRSRAECSADHKIIVKQHDREESSTVTSSDHQKANNPNRNSIGIPSPRTATRRYKLLKDVMC